MTLTYQIGYDYAGENPADFPMVTSFTFDGVAGCEGDNPPTQSPTVAPTAGPTEQPTAVPTNVPTDSPTENPTEGTTEEPVDNGECTTPLTNYKEVIHKSLLFYEAGYRSAGEFEYLLDAVKWGTDYFIKCHVSDNVFYGQVGFQTWKNRHCNLWLS